MGDANGVSERRLHRYLSKVVPGCLKALFYVHHACCAFAWFTTCESAVVALIDLNKRVWRGLVLEIPGQRLTLASCSPLGNSVWIW